MKRWLLLAIMLLLSACLHDKGQDSVAGNQTSGFHVDVYPSQVLMYEQGSSNTLTATLFDDTGAEVDSTQFQWVSSDELVVSVDQNGVVTAVGEGQATITVSASGQSQDISVTVDFNAAQATGRVRYQDKIYSSSGIVSTNAYKPVRNALVDILDGSDNIVQTVSTDDFGYYSFGPLSGSTYTVRVLAQSDSLSGVDVKINDKTGVLYSVTQDVNLSDPSTLEIDISHTSNVSGVFNIYDVLSTGVEFMGSLGVVDMPEVNAFWQKNHTSGTYYCTGLQSLYCNLGEGIYVLNSGSGGDTDEFDDDVLWHEFGHYVVDKYSRDDSPGGCHALSSTDLDLRLSWSEGWGDYFPAAVKSWLASTPSGIQRLSTPTDLSSGYYIDTSGSWALIAIDVINAPGSYRDAGNEIAVANILWQISESYGADKVWQVVQGYLPTVTTPTNMEAFWDGLVQVMNPIGSVLSGLNDIYGSRAIYYYDDAHEDDDDVSLANSLPIDTVQDHHMYKTGLNDTDVISFDLQSGVTYTIETFNLLNGADTYVRIFDAANNTIAENDDSATAPAYESYDNLCGAYRVKNNNGALASKIGFSVPTAGTYYAEVHTTPDPEPYPSAGRYGSYSIKLTQQ